MKSASLKFFRVIGILEAISYLVLLGVAMPLKYFADMPQAVAIVGMLHGVLFVLYLAAVAVAAITHRWSILRVGGAFIASLLPFGPFVFDANLRRKGEL